eukprot:GHVH01003168.1.p2 GENE.GHVH01003168.1~~GHVH01003168.1.p2  ORF type:complete len:360 (+),score=52.11 GHVH01003168.1:1303-2382(+)
MSKVLVTGGSGYIASHAVYQLLEKGYSVRTTVRDASSSKAAFLKTFHPLAAEKVELFEADLIASGPDVWSSAVEGCKYVLHMASPFNLKGVEKEMVNTAVEGTTKVLNAVAVHKETVRKVVVTSSVAAVFGGHPWSKAKDGPFTEEEWSLEETTHGYELSKLRAERRAWELQKEHHFNMDTICPGMVMGPIFAEHHLKSQSSDIMMTFLTNSLWLGVEVSLPLTDVRDVAALHILAMEREGSGERFISASDDHCYSSTMRIAKILTKEVAPKCSYKPPSVQLPNSIAQLLSYVHPDLKGGRNLYGSPFGVSNDKAKKSFGFEFRDMDKGVTDHAISLFKLAKVDSKGYPAEEIEAFSAY